MSSPLTFTRGAQPAETPTFYSGGSHRESSAVGALLAGFQFVSCNLHSSQFADADLHGARFDACDLTHCNFTGANLRGARLGHSDLRDTVFRDADLRDADLTCCNVFRADFTGANLRGARLPAVPMMMLAAWQRVRLTADLRNALMHYDASFHPDGTDAFDAWKSGDGGCPYAGAVPQRACNFPENSEHWDPDAPIPARPFDVFRALIRVACVDSDWHDAVHDYQGPSVSDLLERFADHVESELDESCDADDPDDDHAEITWEWTRDEVEEIRAALAHHRRVEAERAEREGGAS